MDKTYIDDIQQIDADLAIPTQPGSTPLPEEFMKNLEARVHLIQRRCAADIEFARQARQKRNQCG
ncbi:hypothetical protein [Azospirillum agricola]|uniref:hypothetical protein n=1 Tax=Azospirillum agricola TaxID=1720247 RepID=UPI000A0EF6EA|nr:hypothetical protein [Azospirillum agricola]SMH43726.1 hypothetical protein SAMN02982994_1964 [Azospirillum lipoferum]